MNELLLKCRKNCSENDCENTQMQSANEEQQLPRPLKFSTSMAFFS